MSKVFLQLYYNKVLIDVKVLGRGVSLFIHVLKDLLNPIEQLIGSKWFTDKIDRALLEANHFVVGVDARG